MQWFSPVQIFYINGLNPGCLFRIFTLIGNPCSLITEECFNKITVGCAGLEPATLTLSTWCSEPTELTTHLMTMQNIKNRIRRLDRKYNLSRLNDRPQKKAVKKITEWSVKQWKLNGFLLKLFISPRSMLIQKIGFRLFHCSEMKWFLGFFLQPWLFLCLLSFVLRQKKVRTIWIQPG